MPGRYDEKCKFMTASRIIKGEVIPGRRIGRELGFPTGNIALPLDDAVEDGVYSARVTVGGDAYDAMAYVGRRPSVGQPGERLLEIHLFSFEGDLYGKEVETELLTFIRPGREFSSYAELRSQIESDRGDILKILNNQQ